MYSVRKTFLRKKLVGSVDEQFINQTPYDSSPAFSGRVRIRRLMKRSVGDYSLL